MRSRRLRNAPPRTGLVLSAGGVLGGAWTAGALAAVAAGTGWDPADADFIVGTSAGSVFAALTASRVSPERLLPARLLALEGIQDLDEWLLAELTAEDAYLRHGFPRPLPGSLRLTLNGLRDRTGISLLKSIGGLAPQGLVSTEPIQRTIRRATAPALRPHGWVAHPNCWTVACDYQTGDRVVFGRAGAPRAHIAEAVAASCSIPGFFQPVRINDRVYVDGGLHSMSNADLLADRGLDLVVVLSPLSARDTHTGWTPLQRLHAGLRRLAAAQLDREVAKLLDAGTHVLVLEPDADDVQVMGDNVMDPTRSLEVARSALVSMSAKIRQSELRELLSLLPRRRSLAARLRSVTGLLRQMPAAAAV